MTETHRNGPKLFSRWNKGVSRSGLHIGTRFSGRNGTVFTTLLQIERNLHFSMVYNIYALLVKIWCGLNYGQVTNKLGKVEKL
jgi:hypothetical protein